MAVTLAALRTALRVGDSTDEDTDLTRLLTVAGALVDTHMAKGSDPYTTQVQALVDEAIVRLAAYWYDTPPGGNHGSGNGMRHSGAARILRDVRPRSAGVVGHDA